MDQSIIQVARDLFMKFGIKSVSMDDICREAGISKKTMYNLIENKADLITHVVTAHIQEEKMFIEEVMENADDAIEEMIRIAEHVLDSLRTMKPSMAYDLKKYYKESWEILEKIHFTYIKKVIKENIVRGQKQGIYRNDVNSDVISSLYLESSKLMVDEGVFPVKTFPKDGLFKEFIRYHMNGILNDQGQKKYYSYKNLKANESNALV